MEHLPTLKPIARPRANFAPLRRFCIAACCALFGYIALNQTTMPKIRARIATAVQDTVRRVLWIAPPPPNTNGVRSRDQFL